jgi:cytochrome c oxidase subunit II
MGISNAFFLQSVLHSASTQSREINKLFGIFTIAAVLLLLFVASLIIFICIRFRDRPGSPLPRQIGRNNRTELFMFLFPTLMIGIFLTLTIRTIHKVMQPAKGRPDVIITGHQWWWEVYYPSTDVTAANEIHLPVNKNLLIEFHSADVVHDWWVPEFGNKMDVVPGRNNHIWLNITNPGNYIGACSEFCGAEHAWMRIKVFAEEEPAYNAWLDANRRMANMPADDMAMKGMLLFQSASCGSCHRISGTMAKADIGPDLSHIFSRTTMLSGMMPMNEENLHAWISDPQMVKPDSKMPNFIFSKDSVDAVVHYLTQLK